MSSVTAYWHDSFTEHRPPDGEAEAEWTGRLAVREPHPDRAARVRNIRHILQHELPSRVDWQAAPAVSDTDLCRVHDREYIREFERFCENGGGRLIGGTGANEASYRAARRAAGAAVAAAERAVDPDHDDVPYACVRPSGHHAQRAQADGFCFFNNVAVAADAVLTDASQDVDRVAIVDWDVHHGNGTQALFYDRADVLTISLHNDHRSWNPDSHPQTGDVDEHGTGDGEGYNVNVPLPPGTGDEGYEKAFDCLVEPVVTQYDPDLLLVSAGGDPGTVDPLGRNVVSKAGFERMGERARTLADHIGAPLALVQEGGYNVSHLGYAMLGTIEGVLGIDSKVEDPFVWLDGDTESTRQRLASVCGHYATWWDL